MKLTRRGLLSIIPLSLAGATIFRGFKTPALAYKDGKVSVQWFLTQSWNKFSKGMGHAPQIVIVSNWLGDRYEASLAPLQRFVTSDTPYLPNTLIFKSAKLYRVNWLKGWDVKFL